MKTQIIAIGGGANSPYPIEQYILKQTGKSRPKVCFIGTATGDADRNIVRFYEIFGNFDCDRTHLALFSAPKDFESLLMQQDVIHVGGGNTKNLLAIWREWGLEKILYRAWQQGIILSGGSAGSICWFEEGVSDYIPSELNPIKALGFLKGSHCPHFDTEPNRRPRYLELIANGTLQAGIAADDAVALHYINGELHRIVSGAPNAKAYQVKRIGNTAQETELKPDYLNNET